MGKGCSRNGSTARSAKSSGATGLVGGKLEEIAREGAQRMLAEALELEVDEFLQRARYARGRQFRGYRNGRAPERTVGTGMGQVQVKMPRVSDVPAEVAANGFESRIVGRYQRASEQTQRLLAPDQIGGWRNSTWKGYPQGTLSPSFGRCWERRPRYRPAVTPA
jgi:hypothetical protein